MRRLRRLVRGALGALGPVLVAGGGLAGAALAFHAAADWHHHGGLGAGFFHLHLHVGDHHHDDHVQDDSHENQRPPRPADPRDADSRRTGVLTITQALHDVPTPSPGIEPPNVALDGAVSWLACMPRRASTVRICDPRGPPALSSPTL